MGGERENRDGSRSTGAQLRVGVDSRGTAGSPSWPRAWCQGAAGQRSYVLQATAETVYDILSPAAPISRSLQDKRSARRLRKGQQPADLREGVAKAYDTVREVSDAPALLPVTHTHLLTQTPVLTSDLHRASWTRLRPSVMWRPGATSRRG